jgi:hypothetical protein
VVSPVTVIEPLPDWLTEPIIKPGVEVAVYEVMVAPPFDNGAVNATVAEVPLAVVTAPIVGAPGATADTENDWVTCDAATLDALPAWLALIVQVPTVMNVSVPPLDIVHTPEVDDVKATVNPELDVAVSVGVVPKFFVPGFANVIVWETCGVADPDAAEAGPVPAMFVAVTVNV